MKKRKTRLVIECLFPVISVLIAFGQAGRGRARLTGIVTDDAGNPIVSAKIILRLVESRIMGFTSGLWILSLTFRALDGRC